MSTDKVELICVILGLIILLYVLYKGEQKIRINREAIDSEIEDKLK